MKRPFILTIVILFGFGGFLSAQTNHLIVQTHKEKAVIQPTMYGIFFEDINFAADGGLYAELVKNRSFEFPQHLMGWKTFGKVEIRDDGPFPRCPHYVRVSDAGHPSKPSGLDNNGYFGMGIQKGEPYRFSVWARLPLDNTEGKLAVQLVDTKASTGKQPLASAELVISSKEWKKYEVTLTPQATEEKATLRIFLTGSNTIDLEHVSLFPVHTWKEHENGLRKDLAQALADIHPGVLRFPGGCIVEGTKLATRYNWKNTIGPVENRPLNENLWQYTFFNHLYPDYYQSYGLGFFEFFQLAEEIGAEPLPVLNCGMACQFKNHDSKEQVSVDSLDSYIQDALDLIEFANGSTSTRWGKIRADMGHPSPFNLKLLAVGNEQWGPEYVTRLEPFIKAIRKAYPSIRIVGSAGPDPNGEKYNYLWPQMKRLQVDLVDEHYYRPEDWFLKASTRYDNYDRKGPKVFAGEYACHSKGVNHYQASLMEAAFMTGLERNADVVQMATYAPLFAHFEGWQWRPDLIWFDNLHCIRTASYYVQQLYSLHKGTHVLSLTMNGKPVTGQEGQNGLFATAALDKSRKEIIVKIVNTSQKEQEVSLTFAPFKKDESTVHCITLHSDNPDIENTLQCPDAIRPVESTVTMKKNELNTRIAAQTFALYLITE